MSRLKPTSASVTSLQAQELSAQQIPELPEQGRGGRRGASDPAGQVRRHPHLPNWGQEPWGYQWWHCLKLYARSWCWKWGTWSPSPGPRSSTAPWRWITVTSWPQTRWRPASPTGTPRVTSPPRTHSLCAKWSCTQRTPASWATSMTRSWARWSLGPRQCPPK